MKIKTMVIAPYSGLVELTNGLVPDLTEFDITVIQADLSEVLPLIDRIHAEGFDLIISRGGTAELLRKHTHLPVVEIQISGFDLLRIITLVKGYQIKIEMIGFPNIIEGFISVSSLMGTNISYTVIEHEDEVDEALRRAKTAETRVIIGDNITVKKAIEHGLQGVLITSGRESIMEAFRQAKQIDRLRRTYEANSYVYKTLLNTTETGYAIINHSGGLKFANHAFQRMLELNRGHANLYRTCPYFERLVEDLSKGITLDRQMMVYDDEQKIAVAGGEITGHGMDERLYYLKVRPEDRVECEVKIRYSNLLDREFPQLIKTADHGEGTVRSYPAAVYGEKGVGKRLYALRTLNTGRSGGYNALELDIAQCSDASFAALMVLISSASEDRLIYIQGAEKMSIRRQKDLAGAVSASGSRIICSFKHNPKELKEQQLLDAALYETFQQSIVYIPPLRERLNSLDEYIRTFLITFNERYGKQIVGLKSEVMEALYAHPWKENLFELRDIIELFTKHAKGEYIEADALPLLHGRKHTSARNMEETAVSGIDLDKPLEEIEKDIIRIVMEQENMNQSKAAKRLGLNRSTLWRKLKD
ncbi:PrpR N-terminal domain-containing protein [Paenibacillus tarimensis]